MDSTVFDEIEEDQWNNLPSETDDCVDESFSSYNDFKQNQVEKVLNLDDEEDQQYLERKATMVLKDGMDPEMEFKHRKACADTVLEITGRKGNKKNNAGEGPSGSFILPPEAITALVQGMVGLAKHTEKEVEGNTILTRSITE